MVTLAQRIEALRTERNLSRPALSAALGFSKNAVEKFETGRQTPTKDQQDKLAEYFGVSLFYLRGESSDRTRMESWMDAAYADDGPGHVPAPAAPRKSVPPTGQSAGTGQGTPVSYTHLKKKAGSENQDMLSSVLVALSTMWTVW